ncbi:MAG: LamG domain-containing protein, partial [Holophagales bacterium]|nr:LamG domain-containing protein [Holophagales bacterium]
MQNAEAASSIPSGARHHHSRSNPISRARAGTARLGAALWLALVLPSAGWADDPDRPAILRDIHLIADGKFTRPHAPPLRTSADGRIGLNQKKHTGKLAFYLLAPEKLNAPFLETPAGATILASTTPHLETSPEPATLQHTLCDPTPDLSGSGTANPYSCGAGGTDDCYAMKIVGSQSASTSQFKLWSTEVIVRVSQPKTAQAAIAEITFQNKVTGTILFSAPAMFEPTIAGDGRLLVGRIEKPDFSWQYPTTGTTTAMQGTTIDQWVDIVFAVYEGGNPCDIHQWTEIHPISHAPHNTQTKERYGFALQPFVQPDGKTPIPDGVDIQGSYPWIDRRARNLFFTAIGETFSSGTFHRFPYDCVVAQNPCPLPSDASRATRGHSVAGLWTRGKVVLLDNLLNNIDYGFEALDSDQRWLELFEPATDPLGLEDGRARFGIGRDNINSAADIQARPPGYVLNSTFTDSPENRFNFRTETRPITPHDVVWLVNNGKASDEVPFDAYSDAFGFVVADMAVYMKFGPVPDEIYRARFEIHDGWDGTAFTETVLLQNAATPGLWAIPHYGEVFGTAGRYEPGALGGVRGKGFWADGGTGIEFLVEAQTPSIDAYAWYAGIALDPRMDDDQSQRTLIAFPDGSELRLEGLHSVVYTDGSGTTVRTIQLPQLLPKHAWSHLAVTQSAAGTEVDLYLDGFPLDRWRSFSGAGLFRMTPGELDLGKRRGSPTPGFRGWLDQLEIYSVEPDLETACNRAGGTLVGFPAGHLGPMATVADRFPLWAQAELDAVLERHGEPSFDRYACWREGTVDHGAHLANLPAGTTSVRGSVHFPEGPLLHDAKRPDSTLNPFCLSCHTSDGKGGLSLAALEVHTEDLAFADRRRQPLQPEALVFGNLPADWLGPGKPLTALTASPDGDPIDPYLLPGTADVPLAVSALTLVDADTDRDLRTISEGDTLDLAKLGTRRLNVRASTSWPVGELVFDLDGTAAFASEVRKPFALFGKTGGDYASGGFTLGSHDLTATPYPEGGGAAGTAMT